MPKRDEKRGRQKGFAMSILWGVVAGFVVIFVLFMIASSLILSGKCPESAMKTLTAVAALVGSAIGSVVAIKRRRSKILITGLINCVVMFFIMLAGSILSNASSTFHGMTPLLFLMTVLGGAIGVILCLRRKKRKRI